MKRLECIGLLTGWIILSISLPAAAQSPAPTGLPVNVTVCDLVNHPSRYNGELVKVHGRVSFEFEDFTFYDPTCPLSPEDRQHRPVWLSFGGDESTPAVYCCGDFSRDPGQSLEVRGIRIPLLRNSELQEFRERLTAERKERPDGLSCLGRECYFYDLSATITGHFFAIDENKDGGSTGFGHFGFSHGLFIEQVNEVEAHRTEVPAGGLFVCKTETWDVPLGSAQKVLSEWESCSGDKACEVAGRQILEFGAQHWNESADRVASWSETLRDEAEYSWGSPDLLTTYDFKPPHTNENIDMHRTSFTVTKTSCTSLANPLPQSAKIRCESEGRQAKSPEESAAGIQRTVDAGSETWRLDAQIAGWTAVQALAAERSITLSPLLETKGCIIDSLEDGDLASCHWMSRDGMQDAVANFIRYLRLISEERPKQRVAWTPLYVGVDTCKAE